MDLRGFNTYAQVLRKRKPHAESNQGDQSYNSFGSQRQGGDLLSFNTDLCEETIIRFNKACICEVLESGMSYNM